MACNFPLQSSAPTEALMIQLVLEQRARDRQIFGGGFHRHNQATQTQGPESWAINSSGAEVKPAKLAHFSHFGLALIVLLSVLAVVILIMSAVSLLLVLHNRE